MNQESVRVLLVEDDRADQMAVERLVRQEGLPYDLVIAETVTEAVARLQEGRLDVALIDYRLPDGSGPEVQEHVGDTPCIFITSVADQSVAVQAMKAGAFDFLVKDQARDYLALLPVTIENAIRRKQDKDELWQYREHLEEMVEQRTVQLKEANEQLHAEIAERKQAEQALQLIVEGTAATTGEDFFPSLVRSLAEALRVRYSFVAELADEETEKVRLISLWTGADYGQNFEYPLKDTPCEHVVGKQLACYSSGVQELFPKDLWLAEEGIESYLAIPFFDAAGKPTGHMGVMDDKPMADTQASTAILRVFAARAGAELERKRAGEALRKSEEKYRLLFENMMNGFALHEVVLNKKGEPVDYVFLEVNSAFEQLTGLERKNLIGKKVTEALPGIEKDPADWIGRYGKVALTGQEIRFEQHAQPLGKWYSVLAFGPRKGQFATIFEDITERKQAEEELRRSEERLRILFEFAPDAYYLHDLKGNFTDGNRAAEELIGYEREELIGQSFLKLGLLPTRQIPRAAAQLAKNALGRSAGPDEFTLNRKDGTQVAVEIRAHPIKIEGRALVLGIARDITERKRMEEELLKAQKLESVGVLAGGIAHDFNNILTAILGNIGLAKMGAQPGGKVHERLAAAEKASLRARDLTQQLLTFSKGGAPVTQTASIGDLVRDSASFAIHGSPVRCAFSFPGAPSATDKTFASGQALWPVEVDEGQMSRVINNLVINAVQAMPNGGTIRIRAENVTVEAEQVPALEAGRYVQISIEDQGTGIPEEQLPKVFDPYFTTKEGGSGLGLAASYAIVKNHAGLITVETELGVGTTFRIYLPASGKEARARTETGPLPPMGKGRVLVMDDEEIVREVAGQMLSYIGYEAEFARDGAEAIELYVDAKESGRPYDIVIMDLTVPSGMGGQEAIRQLRVIDPEVTAIVSSGYSNDLVMANFEEYGFNGVVAKPFRIQELSAALHGVTTRATVSRET